MPRNLWSGAGWEERYAIDAQKRVQMGERRDIHELIGDVGRMMN
jgi:hypothetical protein